MTEIKGDLNNKSDCVQELKDSMELTHQFFLSCSIDLM